MEFLSENWHWLTAAAIPATAPVVTKAVERFGSPSVKAKWGVVRRVYRLAFLRKGK